jgi:hypothetical protein
MCSRWLTLKGDGYAERPNHQIGLGHGRCRERVDDGHAQCLVAPWHTDCRYAGGFQPTGGCTALANMAVNGGVRVAPVRLSAGFQNQRLCTVYTRVAGGSTATSFTCSSGSSSTPWRLREPLLKPTSNPAHSAPVWHPAGTSPPSSALLVHQRAGHQRARQASCKRPVVIYANSRVWWQSVSV